MGAPYTPTPTYHTGVVLADGASAPTASAFNPGLEGALDNIAFLKQTFDGVEAAPVVFTATDISDPSAAWVCPAGVHRIELEMCGGGGGGGGGGLGGTAANQHSAGGGGGGRAERVLVPVDVTPGETYFGLRGPGGAGGAGSTGGTQGADGSNGTSSQFLHHGTLADTYVVVAMGAIGGRGGVNATSAVIVSPGGSPYEMGLPTAFSPAGFSSYLGGPGFGGSGVNSAFSSTSSPGSGSPLHIGLGATAPGGPGASVGAIGGTVGGGNYEGGGAGGGGASGATGVGGAGGAGGAGGTSGAGAVGTAGADATFAGSGTGGGGGGGGGSGTVGGHGAAGGAGQSGTVILRVIG